MKQKTGSKLLGVLLTLAMVIGLMPGMGLTAYADSEVKYLDASGTEQSITDYTVVDSSTTTFGRGWYVVNSDVEINQRVGISISGDANLILCDGAKLTVTSSNVGIYAARGSLTIYAQSTSDNMGKLVTSGSFGIRLQKNLTINGGKIETQGSNGIFSQDADITINGGNVTADGSIFFNTPNNLTITGGKVIALVTGTDSGIDTEGEVIISGGNVSVTGDDNPAIRGTVKNSIAGTGWTNKAGTEGKADIAISSTGQTLSYKKVQFPAAASHTHNFTYSSDGAVITATCSASGCTLPESSAGTGDHVATLTITAPEDLIYDENAKEAGITDTNKIQGDAKVVYYNATRSGDTYTKTGDALGAAPVEEGDYVAEITLGVENGSHATAAVGFTIVKEYPLWVDGVKVTSENMDDVLGDADEGATVKFTPATTGEQPTPATLTLNGANITKGYENMGANIGIFYESDDGLNIMLADGSVNKVVAADPSAFTTAVSVGKDGEGNVTISGKGKLVAAGVYQAIHASEDLTIEDCTLDVNATNTEQGGSNAICATDGDVLIKSGDIKASALTSIYGNNVTIDGGTVVAAGDETNGCGIYADEEGGGPLSGLVTINSGNVKATGGSEAIHGTVKNAVAGIGWDNTEGTGNGTPIKASSDGQELEFMKVQFPGTSPVEEVTKLIRALPAFNKVRADDEEKILAARAAYEALTDAQKKLVKLSAVRKLKNAETALAGAKKAELQKKKREIAEELADENYVFVREKRAEDAIKAKDDIKEKVDPIKTRSREVQAVLDDIDKSAKAVADKTRDAASKITSTAKRLIRQAINMFRRR